MIEDDESGVGDGGRRRDQGGERIVDGRPGSPAALGGVTITDFSRILAGPLATMMLADLGADVTKVERPGVGDDTRSWGPPSDPTGVPTYFLAVNRNKRSIVLDLVTPTGVGQALELVAASDVVVENFRPGVMDRLGLGWERLHERNPRLVYCSISAFGRGAGADLPGFDLIVQAAGGLMSITGDPAGEPQKVGVAVVDVISGLYASIGILAALRHRDRTGEGQLVEVELLSALLAALSNQSSAYTAGGVVAGRMGNAHPSVAPYEVFPTADGELAIAVGNERQFAGLCAALAAPEMALDGRFATNPLRVANRLALRTLLVARLATGGSDHWVSRLTAAGVPSGPVNDIAGAFDLARRLGLDPTVTLARPDGTSVTVPRNPIRLSASPPTYRHAPPPLGGGPG